MTLQVNIHEAKTQLSKLLARVKEGQEVIIARNGKPIARLIPIVEKPVRRIPGTAKEKILVSPSFNDPLPEELLEDFEN